MIADSSARIAIVRCEPVRAAFCAAMAKAEVLRISAAACLETAMVTDADRDPKLSARLDEIMEVAKLVIEPVTPGQARIARQAYRDYGRGSGHPANRNCGDCFSHALAREKREPMLFKGDGFGHTDIRPALAERQAKASSLIGQVSSREVRRLR